MPNPYPPQSLANPYVVNPTVPQGNYAGYPMYPNGGAFSARPNYPVGQDSINSGIIWVQGESGAKAYPLGPNAKAVLMDSESPTFYIKVTDASGMPLPLRTFDYTERIQMVVSSGGDYVTRDEFDELNRKMETVNKFIGEFSSTPSSAN